MATGTEGAAPADWGEPQEAARLRKLLLPSLPFHPGQRQNLHPEQEEKQEQEATVAPRSN